MSMRYQAAILTASYFPLKVPDAPTIGTATAGASQVSVTFTAPSNVGGGAITSYIAIVTDSSSGVVFTNTGASSPIVVTGLTNGNTYTAKVAATNAFGTGPNSASSSSFSPALPPGQQAYTTAGSYSWVAPAGVTSISVLAIGGGGGGNKPSSGKGAGAGGGGLGYKNNYTVIPGNSYTVFVGAGAVGNSTYSGTYTGLNGNDSYFISTAVVKGGGGLSPTNGSSGGTYTGDGGGNGGAGGIASTYVGGGGGCGGYAGDGGAGASGAGVNNGSNGAGGGGGGGGAGGTNSPGGDGGYGGCGGGTGLLGQGASGTGGLASPAGEGGTGGSGGATGSGFGASNTVTGSGGGGGSGARPAAAGGPGAIRIIWPGTTRSFPSTNTGDL